MGELVLSADIGGSHITTVMMDVENRIEVPDTWFRTRLDSTASAQEIIGNWSNAINTSIALKNITPSKICLAMPGPMDYKKGISLIQSQDKYRELYNLNLKDKLGERLNFNPKNIHFSNDAACFLKGELFCGSLSGFSEAIGLTLGTGLGTSHIEKGIAHDSNLWKMPFLDGIAEDYISTRWFTKRFEELTGKSVKDVKEIIDEHKNSDHFKTLFSEFSSNLAKFIYRFAQSKKPLAAVIGGNIANAEAYFLADTRKHLFEMMGYSLPVKKSILGEKSILWGAATSH
ncbi:ROK family protein [Pedobacter xixiisoli]|uniref:Glucokinase n=1 Tax=Pedobacter xixiisoli TaxID=1476464 RepID=A0A285ZSA6_9SPHI|nr:ROK family protein [Pedobacter xixiisoli]SOD12507.1 glucokinase [Pedobacter xixiisoli]